MTTGRTVHDNGTTEYYQGASYDMPRTTKVLTFSLPPEMVDQVRQVMEEEDRNLSQVIREALRLYMEEREGRLLARSRNRRTSARVERLVED